MQEDLAQHVHAILQHGLQLKKRLLHGETVVLEHEQAILKRMLLTDQEAKRWTDYSGDIEGDSIFLGIRYALVCWLDEIFLIDSPWVSEWNENKLEMALYGTNDRAWRFWEQSRMVEGGPRKHCLLPYFLGVMLGFRGDLRDDQAQLRAWVDNARRQILLAAPAGWTMPPHREPRTQVPPLRGREVLQRMVLSGGIFLLILIPVVAFFLVVTLDQGGDAPPERKPAAQLPGKPDRLPVQEIKALPAPKLPGK